MSFEPLKALHLNTLGVNGLNTQVKDSSLDATWLVQADNAVLDAQGRITCRKGLHQLTQNIGTTSANTKIVKSIGEYLKTDGTREYYCGAGDTIYKYDTSRTPPILTAQNFDATPQTITDGNWQFTNFNGEFYGVQSGHKMINYSGTSWKDIDDVASYAGPTGITTFDASCVFGGYGRLWAGGITENPDLLVYSDTLIGYKWSGAGASGSIDLKTVWPGDHIVAITSLEDKLVIFGTNNIVIYSNPWDPTNMVLDEVIEGVGLVARDTIEHIGDDLIYLSYTGLQSLGRTIQFDGKMPLKSFSETIKDDLNRLIITDSDKESIHGSYHKSEGQYILFLPTFSKAYCFDFKRMTRQGSPIITEFLYGSTHCPKSSLDSLEGTLYLGYGCTTKYGSLGSYSTYYDSELEDVTATYANQTVCEAANNIWDSTGASCWQRNNTQYQYTWRTPWLDFQDATQTKLLKRLFTVIEGGKGASSEISWYRDYNGTLQSSTAFQMAPSGDLYYYGDSASLYGAATYGGSLSSREYRIPLSKEAKVVQLKAATNVAGYSSSWINMTVLAKGGKIR